MRGDSLWQLLGLIPVSSQDAWWWLELDVFWCEEAAEVLDTKYAASEQIH